ncbi:MAG: hypothetical protein HY901_29890, partial [Deltaproteobacteria bacterium]|nr:hypothetical protein [Deltaproteobacteria bacterium]
MAFDNLVWLSSNESRRHAAAACREGHEGLPRCRKKDRANRPLGTGTVSNAQKREQCPPESLAAAIASMAMLNRGAAEALNELGVHACTDVTGFGLVGHLLGMLKA